MRAKLRCGWAGNKQELRKNLALLRIRATAAGPAASSAPPCFSTRTEGPHSDVAGPTYYHGVYSDSSVVGCLRRGDRVSAESAGGHA
jgi:hypothetical protein